MRMVSALCKRITSKLQLTDLGINLDLQDYEIERILEKYDAKSLPKGAFEMLTVWRGRTKDDKEAFQLLE